MSFAVVAALLSPFAFATPSQSFAANPAGQLPLAPTPQVRPCAPRYSPTPQWRTAVSMSSPASCGSSPWPYGARYSPGGERLYVTLFGGLIGNGGCRVLRLDPLSFATLAEVPTGESPQDIAFVTHANGDVRLGFVANSSDSSVTVFDAQDAVVATIPIPYSAGAFFPTAFPASFAVSPSQRHVYVSTQDGTGRVLAIDTATLQLDLAREIQLGADHTATRMVFAGNKLVIGAAEALPNWVGSTAKVMAVDLAQPQLVQELALATASDGFHFPAVQDCAVDCDGTVWVAGYDMGARVFGIDPLSLTLRYVVPTHTSQADGKFQALGLSRDGLLCVADMWTHEISVLDIRLRRWRATLDTAQLPSVQQGAQELEFSPDGRTLLATWAATDNLGVFDL
jgi:hypothetical protein